MVKSSLDVVRRVLHPSLPIEPQTIRVVASQNTDLGRVTYANSITLTPGTLTVDALDDQFTVHAIDDYAAESLRSGAMDRKITDLEPAGDITTLEPEDREPIDE